jgi:hypothetical protein
MALRITHGLFRLWLVFSVLWVVGVAGVSWSTFPVDDWVNTSNVTPDDFIPDEFAAYKACMATGKSSDDCAAVLKPPFDPSKPYRVVRDDERRTAVWFAATLAIVPPILILVLGSALGWAFKGFSSRANP